MIIYYTKKFHYQIVASSSLNTYQVGQQSEGLKVKRLIVFVTFKSVLAVKHGISYNKDSLVVSFFALLYQYCPHGSDK